MSKFTGATASFAKQPTKCSKCGTIKAKKACCKDEEKWLKIKDLHQKSSILFQTEAPVFLLQPQNIFKQFKPLERTEAETTDDKSPPEVATPALFILHNVFRI